MRKRMTLLLCSLLWLSATIAYAGSNIMKIHDVTAIPGENILIEIEVINEDQFVAFQVDIPFPEGFGYVANSFALTARSNGHLANANVLPGTNVLRALAFSMTNLPFFGNSGVVATFGLTTPATPGTHELVPTGAIISNAAGQQILTGVVNGIITLTTGTTVIPGDANCDGNVNANDVITIVNYILVFNPQPFCFENADINGDGSVNAIDVIGTVNIILGGGTFTCGVSTITDYDGNVYNTVLINNQCWMKENLKTTKYRNSTPIEYPGDNNSAWQNNTSGAYAWYDNDISWKDSYGALYNWHAANNTNGLCPTGWHVPSDYEWTQLVDYLIAQGFPNQIDNPNGAGNALKSCRQVNSPLGGDCNTTEHPRWEEDIYTGYNHHGFDEFGFSAFPGGERFTNGSFGYIGYNGLWQSSTEYSSSNAWYRYISYIDGTLRGYGGYKAYGFSVRCLRDN